MPANCGHFCLSKLPELSEQLVIIESLDGRNASPLIFHSFTRCSKLFFTFNIPPLSKF